MNYRPARRTIQKCVYEEEDKLRGAAPPCNLSVWEPRFEGLHGVGRPNCFQKGPAKAAVASATTSFHWQDPCLSTESSRGEKTPACLSVLGVAG